MAVIMPWKNTPSVLAALLVAGLGLTACGGGGSDAKGDAAPSAKPPATSAPEAPASDAPSGDVKAPEDLPAGLPLPNGKLTSVTGDKGAYVLTYTADDPAQVLESYSKDLEGKGYTVVDVAGTVTATKGTDAVSVVGTGTTIVVTVSS
ncbi:hypothetical protein ACGFMM_25155 [Streptomyces sp. NPDC048604]|uniref:hypothetical protein n=1 Tax=Streptomyces sp. NPDC048604 TaxID=3365578 RepID=UPI00370FD258